MGHLCCVCIISSAEIKKGRRPDALPMKDATSSRNQPCGCRAPGCAVARVCVPGSFSGLHWSSDFPSGGSVVRRAAVLGAPSSATGTQRTLLSVLAEARGPWVLEWPPCSAVIWSESWMAPAPSPPLQTPCGGHLVAADGSTLPAAPPPASGVPPHWSRGCPDLGAARHVLPAASHTSGDRNSALLPKEWAGTHRPSLRTVDPNQQCSRVYLIT